MQLELIQNPAVDLKFSNYPPEVRDHMIRLRELVLQTANEIQNIASVEETLKWGEPSYLTKHGSTLRMDWKAKKPDQYAMYFKCTSRLVETFKEIFGDTFEYEGSRAIVFKLEDELPREELKQCIKATLTYHKVKQLPLLGITH
jgi:hypothetical protein